MSGTVFVDAGAGVALAEAPAESEDAGAADAVVGAALTLAAAVAALGDAEFEVPELAGAPVPVEVPEGVQAAARAARSDRPSERKVVMTGEWDDTTEGPSRKNQPTACGFEDHELLSLHHTRRRHDQGGARAITRRSRCARDFACGTPLARVGNLSLLLAVPRRRRPWS